MSATNFLELIDEAQLLADYYNAYAEWKAVVAGQDFVTVTVGNKSFTKTVRAKGEVETHMATILMALKERNPNQYGQLVTRTAASFV